jgi:hypothetical protein
MKILACCRTYSELDKCVLLCDNCHGIEHAQY